MFGVSRFKGKVAVIAGAEHPIGNALARRLAGFGATVIVLGRAEGALMALARVQPERIEPLALRDDSDDILALLQEAWGDHPVDVFVDLMAICAPPVGIGATRGFAATAGVAAALMRGLRAARAQAVLAVPAAGDSASPEEQARHAGYAALVRRFDQEARPGRVMGLTLPCAETRWNEADCLDAGDVILTLGHAVSRGLRGGVVLDWAPRSSREADSGDGGAMLHPNEGVARQDKNGSG